jgi:hypothetical protein
VNSMHYVGLDVHKKTISNCLRQADGTIVQEGKIASTRQALTGLLECFPQPWVVVWKPRFSAPGSTIIFARKRIGEGSAFNDAKGDRGRQAKE